MDRPVLSNSTFNTILGYFGGGRKTAIPQFKRERTKEPAARTQEVQDAIKAAFSVLLAKGVVVPDTVEAHAAQAILDWLGDRLLRVEWDAKPHSKPLYFLDEIGSESQQGLQVGKFCKRLRELAIEHLLPKYVVAEARTPEAAAAAASDLEELRNNPEMLQAALDKQRKNQEAATSAVMGKHMRRLVEICRSGVRLLRAGQNTDEVVDVLDVHLIMRVIENVIRALMTWAKDKDAALVGATGLGKSTALSALLQLLMDFSAYVAAPFPNELVRMLPALEYMQTCVAECVGRELIDLVDDPCNLVVNMPLHYAENIAEEAYKFALSIFKHYGEEGKLPNGMMTVVPSMSAGARATTELATRFAFYSYGVMFMELLRVEQVQDQAAALVGHMADKFRKLTKKKDVAAAQEVKAKWQASGSNGKPGWCEFVVAKTEQDPRRLKELQVQEAWYLAACGNELPWGEDETGRPFISLQRDKVPVRLEELLRARRLITCCGPKAPATAAEAAAAARRKLGYQVLRWLADIQVLLNNLGGVAEHQAAAKRMEGCLPPELAGMHWPHLVAVLKMPVRVFYSSLALAAVGGIEDLPGSGATEVHDSISAEALSNRITTAFVVTSKSLENDMALKDTIMQEFVPAMVRSAKTRHDAAQQAAPAAAAAAVDGSGGGSSSRAVGGAGAAAASPFRAAPSQRQVVLVSMPETLRRINGEMETSLHIQKHFKELNERDAELCTASKNLWNGRALMAARGAWQRLQQKSAGGDDTADEEDDDDDDDDDEDEEDNLPDYIKELVQNPPAVHSYTLNGLSVSNNLDLRRDLQQARQDAEEEGVELLPPSADEVAAYCNPHFVLQHLVGASKEQLQSRLEELLQVVGSQHDTFNDLTALLQQYGRRAPPVCVKARMTGEQAQAFNNHLNDAYQPLASLHNALKALSTAVADELRDVVPQADTAVRAWVAGHAAALADPVTHLQPKDLGRTLHGVVRTLCTGFEDVFAQVEPRLEACMRDFTAAAAKSLASAAIAYFQQTVGMSADDVAEMNRLLGTKQAEVVKRLLDNTLDCKVERTAAELTGQMGEALDEEMRRMLAKLHRSLQAAAPAAAAAGGGSGASAAGAAGGKRPRNGDRPPPPAAAFLLGKKGVQKVLQRVAERMVEAVGELLEGKRCTVETVARLPQELSRDTVDRRVGVNDRGQFKAIMVKVIKSRYNQGRTRTPQGKAMRTVQEQLASIKGWLLGLKADVDAMAPGQLDEVVVLTRQPPVRLLDPGLNLAPEVLQDPARVGAVLLHPDGAASRAGLFQHIFRDRLLDKPATEASRVRDTKRGGRNAHQKELDAFLGGLGLRRVGVSPHGDRVCNALLVAMTGDKKTPAPQGQRLALRRGAVAALTALPLTSNTFEGAMKEYLAAAERFDELQDWAMHMGKEGAGADYLFLQGVVQAMNIRLLVFVPPLEAAAQTPATATKTVSRSHPAAGSPALPSSSSLPQPRRPQVHLLQPVGAAEDDMLPVYGVALVHSSREAGGGPIPKLNHMEAVVPIDEGEEQAADGVAAGGDGGGGGGNNTPAGSGSGGGGAAGGPGNGGGAGATGGIGDGAAAGPSGSQPGGSSHGGAAPGGAAGASSDGLYCGSIGDWAAGANDNDGSDAEQESGASVAAGGGAAAGGDVDMCDTRVPRSPSRSTPQLWVVIDQSFERAPLDLVRDFVDIIKASPPGAAGAQAVSIGISAAPNYVDIVRGYPPLTQVTRDRPKQCIAKLLHEVFFDAAGRWVVQTASANADAKATFLENLETARRENITRIQEHLHASMIVSRNLLLQMTGEGEADTAGPSGGSAGGSGGAVAGAGGHVLLLRCRSLKADARSVPLAPPGKVPKGGWVHVADLREVVPELKRAGSGAAGLLDWMNGRLRTAQGHVLDLPPFRYWIKPLSPDQQE
ncbi:hypothetical protein HXX76_013254 [Chlamydomonas incerta]|uniref:Uncharacterized protein n=1 Tax=Chlamydomonas incerta TaxID=51695 RepID=A0A835SUH9_CHLIN|nr:hypothetical protein HXX76_013254 [Chlamydomonas incerta]|eukprot:KAG2426066.1 hypothetical protein HXX76_013254 [Chlamydomonas incerta]